MDVVMELPHGFRLCVAALERLVKRDDLPIAVIEEGFTRANGCGFLFEIVEALAVVKLAYFQAIRVVFLGDRVLDSVGFHGFLAARERAKGEKEEGGKQLSRFHDDREFDYSLSKG
jgi:hypothetical protein